MLQMKTLKQYTNLFNNPLLMSAASLIMIVSTWLMEFAWDDLSQIKRICILLGFSVSAIYLFLAFLNGSSHDTTEKDGQSQRLEEES